MLDVCSLGVNVYWRTNRTNIHTFRVGWILGSCPPEIQLETEGRSRAGFYRGGCIPKKNRHPESVPMIHGSSQMGYIDKMVAGAYVLHEKKSSLPLYNTVYTVYVHVSDRYVQS